MSHWHAEADRLLSEGHSIRSVARSLGMTDDRSLRRYVKRQGIGVDPTAAYETRELIDAMVDGAVAARANKADVAARVVPLGESALAIIVADPHFGKLCWGRGTGGQDFDLDIALLTVTKGVRYILEQPENQNVERVFVVSCGDWCHYDTPSGTTSAGTYVDRDSRVPKMLEVATTAFTTIVEDAATLAPTHVVSVPGNHDEVLSAALQRVMVAHFRNHPRVTVDDTHTRTKAWTYGRNLLVANHGDRRKKVLAASIAVMYPQLWGETVYREAHVGHTHNERTEGTMTESGVIVRTHRSISPPDSWHADELWVGAPRGLTAFRYHKRGGLLGSTCFDPDLHMEAA